jgi:hypothetical protein
MASADILKLPSAAILIDCWDMSDSAYHNAFENLYTKILQIIDNTPEISLVILASYDCADLDTNIDNIWYNNTKLCLPRSNKTSPQVLNYRNSDKLQIAITSFDELMGFLNKHTDIENLYLMGTSWLDCIHNRPIGIHTLSDVGKNVLVHTDYVWHSIDSAGLDLTHNQRYARLSDNIYLLVKQNKKIVDI